MATVVLPQNTTGLVSFISWADGVVNGWFGPVILLALFMVIFLATKKEESKQAFAVAGFLTAIVAVMLRVLEIIPDRTLIISVVVAGAGILWLVVDREKR